MRETGGGKGEGEGGRKEQQKIEKFFSGREEETKFTQLQTHKQNTEEHYGREREREREKNTAPALERIEKK